MNEIQKLQEALFPQLQQAEKLRKKHVFFKKLFSILVLLMILGFLFSPMIIYLNNAGFSKWIGNTMKGKSTSPILLIMVLYWLPFFIILIASNSYKNKYKAVEKELLKSVLGKIAPEFRFNPRKQISSKQIEESKLLPTYFQVGKNKTHQKAYNLDLGTLTGKVGETSITLGNVNINNQGIYNSFLMYIPLFPFLFTVYNYVMPYFSKHHSTENLGSNYVGMFAVADFNKKLNGHTVILPDIIEKRMGYLAKNLQALNFTRGQLVHLDNPEFENDFVVYSTDQVEARYILSTSLMERITNLKRRIDKPMMLSFNKNKLYMGIQQPHGFLSLSKSKSLIKPDVFEILYEDISVALGIVDDLNLNRRIWNKEATFESD